MDMKESRRTIRVPKTVCKETEERPIDLDIVFPDYYPDVTAILKCVMQPSVYTGYQSGDRYTVDGAVKIRILYLSEDRREIYCYEAIQPFSAVFRCEGAVHYKAETKNDYLNCRAVGPKRVDVHGAFRVCLTAIGEGTFEVFEDPCLQGVHCKKKTIGTTVPVCENEKAIVVDEVLVLGMQADEWLYADVTVASCECKVLTNKAILKGTLSLKGVCKKETETHTVLREIPFSQIVDADGLSETALCETEVRVCECDCHLQQNEAGASVLYVSCKLNSYLRCSCREETTVVLDAYSVDHAVLCRYTGFQSEDRSQVTASRMTLQEYITLPEHCVSIDDQWGRLQSCELCCDENGTYLTCCVLVCMLTRDSDGQVACYERTVDCRVSCDPHAHHASARLIDVQCAVNGDKVRVQMDAEITQEYACVTSVDVVTQAVNDTAQVYVRPSGAIRIVYAEQGDSVWEIAKAHHSSVDEICAENDLNDEYIPAPTMLMIPML